ncbi:MAG: hypothetical protein AB2637_12380 [Candidatus Thiodiazotropha sp.]|nr:hypothetical protein [Candidatus Thiodiazotropha taylori]MBT3064910.1 hypothetical protein [Candidatus Thiodiazotropha sp. (ex Lucina pensylvanica)]
MKKLIGFISAQFLILSAYAPLSQAATITYFQNLNIGGSLYNATIHTSGSFNTIWDNNGNGVFGDSDGSIINHSPTFWQSSNASLAAQAVIDALGTSDTYDGLHDRIAVPYDTTASNTLVYIDRFNGLTNDELWGPTGLLPSDDYTILFPSNPIAYVSFENASPVPIPAAVWLFGTGVIGLLGFNFRNTKK